MMRDMNANEILKHLPAYCIEDRNRKVYRTLLQDKPLYVFANHAAAVEVWLTIAKEHAVNLVIFDDHNDSIYPFRSYRNACLSRDNEELMRMLNEMKNNLDELQPTDLYQVGKYIKDYHCWGNSKELRNDEHNILGLFLNLLNEVYICSPASLGHGMDPECPKELQAYYQHLHCMQSCFHEPDAVADSICLLASDTLLVIKEHAMSNMGDDLMFRLFAAGLNVQGEYVLDIDLDYFKIPFWRTPVPCFGDAFRQIVRNAKAITIATEPMYVKESAECFSSASSKAALDGVAKSAFGGEIWTPVECLHWLLRELENMLSTAPA